MFATHINLDVLYFPFDTIVMDTEVNCGPPPQLYQTSLSYSDTSYANHVIYDCHTGYQFEDAIGGSTNHTLTCSADGAWQDANGLSLPEANSTSGCISKCVLNIRFGSPQQ